MLECHISMTFQKIQKNFRSLCTLVIKIHESCCSIFNELCFSLHCLAARSLFIIPLCRSFVKRFFKLFFKFFSSSRLSPTLRCRSLAAPIVYHILPRLSTPFCKFFQDFSIFPAGKVTALGFLILFRLHQGRIPRHTCRFYCCLAAHQRTRKKDSAEPSFPILWTPPHPPGAIRCGGAYRLPRWTGI